MGRFISGFFTAIAVMVLTFFGGLVAIGHGLRLEDPLAPADAIVAISGDTGPRTATAVQLWRDGYAPLIVFSGAALDPTSVSSAEIMRRNAVAAGVPEESVLVESLSTTTDENAQLVAELMSQAGLRSAILVTSPYHQRRAALHFSREFTRADLVFRNYPARDPRWDPNVWWAEEPSRSLTIIELAKLAFEALDGR